MKIKSVVLAGLTGVLFSTMGFSQNGTPSSKAAAAINTLTVCANSNSTANVPCTNQSNEGVWLDVMQTTIKTSNVADLFGGVSLVTGLYTNTNVKGNNTGAASTSVAQGTVQVRLLIDNTPGLGFPDTTGDGVIFDQRIQTLTANIGNVFSDCFANGGTTGTGCVLTPQEITLVLDTTAAHSFNFLFSNVGTGLHTLRVQAIVSTSTTGTDPGNVAVANALFGLGSLTLDAVKLVNSFSF